MAPVIDSHTHIFPDAIADSPTLSRIIPLERLDQVRRRARAWLKPVSSGIHQAQTMLRYLPDRLRDVIDEVGTLAPLPMLLVESTARDLDEAMSQAGVDYSVIIAHPGMASNEFILEAAERNPKLLPVVNIGPGVSKPGIKLKKYVQQGARMLKIHAAADGDDRESSRYSALLRTADELGLPVILHTGCLHSHVLYKSPEKGDARYFVPWFEKYPKLRFILAHMNYHEPGAALDLAERYPNLVVDTSWQPAEVIGEAVRRIGADRVLFGSDWPFAGGNLGIGVKRIRECLDIGTLTPEQGDLVLGGNAVKLLGLPS